MWTGELRRRNWRSRGSVAGPAAAQATSPPPAIFTGTQSSWALLMKQRNRLPISEEKSITSGEENVIFPHTSRNQKANAGHRIMQLLGKVGNRKMRRGSTKRNVRKMLTNIEIMEET